MYKINDVVKIVTDLGWKCLSDQYSGHKSLINCICPNGHVQKRKLSFFIKNKKCEKCFHIDLANSRSFTLEKVKKDIEEERYSLLSTKYINVNFKLDLLCENGHRCLISYKKFKTGSRCKYCSMTGHRSHEEIENEINSLNFKLLSKYKNSKEKITLSCTKNHIFNKKIDDFRKNPSCKECEPKKRNLSDREKRKEYNKTDIGIYSRYKSDSRRRSRAKRNISFDLTFDVFSNLIKENCYYCDTPNSRGIDRVDSDRGYFLENSVPCCRICNAMKSNLSEEFFIQHLLKIIKKRSV